MENQSNSGTSSIEWVIFKICDHFLSNPHLATNYIADETLLKMLNINVTNEELVAIQNKITSLDLFETIDSGSKDDNAISIRMANGGIQKLRQYGGYFNYEKRIILSVPEIIDQVFENLKECNTIQLEDYLRQKYIVHDNSLVFKVVQGFKGSGLAEVKEDTWGSKQNTTITINGRGLDELASKSYSKYKSEQKRANMQSPSISIGGSVVGSSVGQLGDFKQENKESFNTNQPSPQKEVAKKTLTVWESIPEWAKILGGIGAIAALIKVIVELFFKK